MTFSFTRNLVIFILCALLAKCTIGNHTNNFQYSGDRPFLNIIRSLETENTEKTASSKTEKLKSNRPPIQNQETNKAPQLTSALAPPQKKNSSIWNKWKDYTKKLIHKKPKTKISKQNKEKSNNQTTQLTKNLDNDQHADEKSCLSTNTSFPVKNASSNSDIIPEPHLLNGNLNSSLPSLENSRNTNTAEAQCKSELLDLNPLVSNIGSEAYAGVAGNENDASEEPTEDNPDSDVGKVNPAPIIFDNYYYETNPSDGQGHEMIIEQPSMVIFQNRIVIEVTPEFSEIINQRMEDSMDPVSIVDDTELEEFYSAYGIYSIEKIRLRVNQEECNYLLELPANPEINIDEEELLSIMESLLQLPNVLFADPVFELQNILKEDLYLDYIQREFYTPQELIPPSDSSITVAVIDTGIDYDHPDIKNNLWWINRDELYGYIDDACGWDFIDDEGELLDYNGHGTHISGIIGGESGINPFGKIMNVKAFNKFGQTDTITLAKAIYYAADNGANIINASWSIPPECPSTGLVGKALFYAINKGCVIVSPKAPYVDCNSLNGVCVIEIRAGIQNDITTDDNCYGHYILNLQATVYDILSLRSHYSQRPEVEPGYTVMRGASMTTALVSGLVAKYTYSGIEDVADDYEFIKLTRREISYYYYDENSERPTRTESTVYNYNTDSGESQESTSITDMVEILF